MAAIQAVFIRGHEERSEPKPHIVYKIEIQASVRSWQMWRRYSEFDELNTELTKSTGAPPPCSLPPKHTFSISIRRTLHDAKVIEERMQGLEAYLRAIISSKEDQWQESLAFKAFLGVPVGKLGGVEAGDPSQLTSSSWLDVHIDLQGCVRDVRADINRRDALSERGDIAASHSANVQAKKKIASILSRVGTLTRGLESLALAGMKEGEVRRRSDMVARLQDDCESLSKMVMASRNPSSKIASTALGSSSIPSGPDRAALLDLPAVQKPPARVFGAPPPKETDQTRPLDDHGLFVQQQVQMEQQDVAVSQLATILGRQKVLASAIYEEITEQNEMLDDLSNDVDRVGDKLRAAKTQLNRLG
ncbi:syntaxin [Rickenella mellea]|uniref:Syntaxin n=1 Tax=Rickenella mellea TaxID=50990 RepID=A0A4Y7QNU2_9AGAM|nr:syntaxin [Rickenella mellea]